MPIRGSFPIYDAAGTATATLLRGGYTTLNFVEVENRNTVPVYLQLFNAATAGAVTLGTTTPDQTRMIPAGAGGSPEVNTSRLIDTQDAPMIFGSGLVYAITTTRSGSTAAANTCPINFGIA